jgi:hypothetical protein
MTDQQTTETERPTPSGDRTGRLIAGASLVIAGLGLFALEAFDEGGDAAILFTVGAVFLAFYFMRRIYGLLVAGSIIVGVGLGILLERMIDTSGDVTVLGIGIGFVMIYVIDRLSTPTANWWPLIPGGILLVIGLSALAGASADLIWPALLVAAGVVLVAGAARRRD